MTMPLLLVPFQFFSTAHDGYNNNNNTIPFRRLPQFYAASSSSPSNCCNSPPLPPTMTRRRAFSPLFIATTGFFALLSPPAAPPFNNDTWAATPVPLSSSEFFELPNSGGVRALDLRVPADHHPDGERETTPTPTPTTTPSDGDMVVIHYYGRLAAKQGWRFDSTYDHKDDRGEPLPFQFVLGSGKVIAGIESAVRTMKVGGIRRVIIPPSQGYQNTSQEPIPPNFFDRQRLFTTIFNPTRLANGEGSTLGTLIFDIELIRLIHY